MSNWHNEVQATVHLTNLLIVEFTEVGDDYRNAQTRFQINLTRKLFDRTTQGLPPSNEITVLCQSTELELLEKSLSSMEGISSEVIVLVELNPGNSSDAIPDTGHLWNDWIKRIIVGSVAAIIVIITIAKVVNLSI